MAGNISVWAYCWISHSRAILKGFHVALAYKALTWRFRKLPTCKHTIHSFIVVYYTGIISVFVQTYQASIKRFPPIIRLTRTMVKQTNKQNKYNNKIIHYH